MSVVRAVGESRGICHLVCLVFTLEVKKEEGCFDYDGFV